MSILKRCILALSIATIFSSCSMFQSHPKRDIASDPCANHFEHEENQNKSDKNYNRCHGL